jgi:hypothetical protein
LHILKNYIKNKDSEDDTKVDVSKNIFEGIIIGGLGGVIFNQLITNTDANIAKSLGMSINDFYNLD